MCFCGLVFGLHMTKPDSLRIQCTIKSEVKSNDDLNAGITLTNKSETEVPVYQELIPGHFDDMNGANLVNFDVEVEKSRVGIGLIGR
jgi:hypothetical protein